MYAVHYPVSLQAAPAAFFANCPPNPRETEAYSAFAGSGLFELLQSLHICRIFAGGIATEYCVHNTVIDALQLGYSVVILQDAIQALNRQPNDGRQAVQDMIEHGAQPAHFCELAA